MPIDLDPLPQSEYTGRYTDEAQVVQYAGTLNVDVHADVNSDTVRDTGAVQQAIISAESRVDLYTSGPWTFQDNANGEVVAQLFNQWAYKFAVYELAAKRGFAGLDQNEFIRVNNEVLAEMAFFKENPMPGADGPDEDDDDDAVAGAGNWGEVDLIFEPADTSDEYSG